MRGVYERLDSKEPRNVVSPENFITQTPKIAKVLEIAKSAHSGQLRKSGEPFYYHPIAVAQIITHELGLTEDEDLIAAALLHDTVEDNPDITLQAIEEACGLSCRNLVDGVTKADAQTSHEVDRETVRKVSDRSYLEPRVAIIKLADRLHNMRTLEHMSPEKQIEKAKETIEIYAPMAQSLGMWEIKRELEDLCFMYLYPNIYEEIRSQAMVDPRVAPDFLAFNKSRLESLLADQGVEAHVDIRFNSLWQLHKKKESALLRGKTHVERGLSDLNDLVSFRVTTSRIIDCFTALGAVQIEYPDIDHSRFDDFIGQNARVNGYQALQVTRNTPQGAVEIAIATTEMEEFNKMGVVSLIKQGEKDTSRYTLKSIFTENGDGLKVHYLRKASTGIDLAYSINPILGTRIENLWIDGEIVDPATIIPNASIVEIILDEDRITPPLHFINFCQPESREIIKEQHRLAEAMALEEKGRALAAEYLAPRGILKLEHINNVMNLSILQLSESTVDIGYLYRMIGMGAISKETLNNWLDANNITKDTLGLASIELTGVDAPHIFNSVSAIISSFKGNIEVIEQKKADGEFYLLVVVSGLVPDSEKSIRDYLSSDTRFKTSLLV